MTQQQQQLLIELDSTKGIKVNAEKVAKPFREEIQQKVIQLKTNGREAPLLVGILANNDPAAKQYAEWTGKACQADGLRYELRTVNDPVDVEEALRVANDDPTVHGIIVYYPIFGQQETYSGTSQDDYIRDTISYKCDVEGLCYLYRTNLYKNIRYLDYPNNTNKCLLPCTALAVVKILEQCPGVYYESNNNIQSSRFNSNNKHEKQQKQLLNGKIITIINRSEIVGRPLAAMLANDGATVYSVDINSIYIFSNGKLHTCHDETPESCVKKSSVVITGVPTKSYRLPTEWIQPYTTVINVASYKNVDENSLLQIPGVVYVPQVGKVTVAMLERNLMRLYEQFHSHSIDDANAAQLMIQQQQQKNINQKQPASSQQIIVEEKVQKGLEPISVVSQPQPWYGHPLNLYTAAIVTYLLYKEVRK